MAHIQNKKQLRAAGGFVHAPKKKTIGWKHLDENGVEQDDTVDIYIVANNLESMMDMAEEPPKGVKVTPYRLSQSLMMENESGNLELVTYDECRTWDPELSTSILKAINEERAPKASPPKTSSFVISSPEASGGEQ
jgi:hypothetical protein